MSKTGYRVSFLDAVDVDGDLPSTASTTSTRARPKFQKSQTTPVLQEPSEVARRFFREVCGFSDDGNLLSMTNWVMIDGNGMMAWKDLPTLHCLHENLGSENPL